MVRPTKQSVATGVPDASSETRRIVFVERYLVNGNNGAEAARFAGFSAATSNSKANQLLKEPATIALLTTRAKQVVAIAELTTERWAREMAAIGHFDPGELYDEMGNLIPIYELPEHVRRAISSVEQERRFEGKCDSQTVVETTKVKMNDKNTALANIGKHLGMFEEDNRQQARPVQVLIQLMG